MKLRITIETGQVRIDETVNGQSEADIWRLARRELERRAPMLLRPVIRTMSDQALWNRITELHNKRAQAAEPPPTSAHEFIAFGERTGYITRLE